MNRKQLLEYLREWLAAYPEDVFPPITVEETRPFGSLCARISASMARHILRKIIADYEE